MDIISLSSTDFKNGVVVNGLKKVKWIERYNEPGEFEITAPPTDAIRTQLAVGSIITHINTKDVMMVEDHEIDESDDEVVLTITGRSLTGFFLENRAGSGTNFSYANPDTNVQNTYEFLSRKLVDNLVEYMKESLVYGTISAADVIPTLTISAAFTGTDTNAEMVVPRGDFENQVLEKLEQLDAGMKFERPIGSATGTNLIIHKGTDLSASVVFAADFGDLTNTRYFWSNQKYRNSAIVVGKYQTKVMRAAGVSGLNMRVMYVDAKDYEFNPSITGSTADFDKADRILNQKGNQALAQQRLAQYIETDISPMNRYRYRFDYNIGDIVFVRGNYGVSQLMRVVEFAEFEDETGEVGVPTVKPLAS